MPERSLHRNEITLVGTLSRDPWPQELPDGEQRIMLRLLVARPPVKPSSQPRPKARAADSLTCAVLRPMLRRNAARWRTGDVVEVTGALRSRFVRMEAGPRNLYEVEAIVAKRLARGPGETETALASQA